MGYLQIEYLSLAVDIACFSFSIVTIITICLIKYKFKLKNKNSSKFKKVLKENSIQIQNDIDENFKNEINKQKLLEAKNNRAQKINTQLPSDSNEKYVKGQKVREKNLNIFENGKSSDPYEEAYYLIKKGLNIQKISEKIKIPSEEIELLKKFNGNGNRYKNKDERFVWN